MTNVGEKVVNPARAAQEAAEAAGLREYVREMITTGEAAILEDARLARKQHDARFRAELQKYREEMFLPLGLRGTTPPPKRLVVTGTTEDGRRVQVTIQEIDQNA